MDLASAIHSHPYLDDGNVALAALTSKGVCHVFRVHRSVLCMQSVIFADMFAVSAPTNAASHETYAGAALVRMPDDAKDLEELLKMIYDSSPIPISHFDPHASMLLEGALKLATKYDIPSIRARIVQHLQVAWPSTLKEWDARAEKLQGVRSQHRFNWEGEGGASKVDGLYFSERVPEPASAVRIARLYDVPKILPAAYYDLYCIGDVDRDWDDYRQRPIASPRLNDIKAGRRAARWSQVDLVDMKRLMRLQKHLTNRQLGLEADFFDVAVCGGTQCQQRRAMLSLALFEGKLGWFQGNDVLEQLDKFGHTPPIPGMCTSCHTNFTGFIGTAREEIWSLLPRWLEF